jgi:glucokinase
MSSTSCLAIDIGGTKLAAGIVDADGALRARRQIPTPQGAGDEELLAALVSLCDEVCRSSETRPLMAGVGCGGPMDPRSGVVSPLNIPAWRSFPLVRRLHDELGLAVAVDNDAKALALGEGWRGAARGVDSFMAIVVSTGIGGGIVLNGRLLDGRLGNAGHLGHLVVVPDGRRCRCGVRGCLEAEASGTAIEAISGRPASEATMELKERTGDLVGRAVASAVTLLDLDLCVVAGSVALGFGAPFFAAAQRALSESTGLTYTDGASIVPAGLGDEGPLIGAAAVGFTAERALEELS